MKNEVSTEVEVKNSSLTPHDTQFTESKVREFINGQPFAEILHDAAKSKWDGKPLTEDKVYHLNEMGGLKVAIIRENRRTHRRAMKMNKACMKVGMTTPAILVPASVVNEWGLTLIDPTSGRELTEEELKDYYCVMEGHARLDAWVISLISSDEPFDFHFVFKHYSTSEEFGKAYTSCNVDMTRTTSKDRLAIAGARSKDPIVISYLKKTKEDQTIPKASQYWTFGRELAKDEVSKLIYGDANAPKFEKALTDALSLCYESFKARFSADGAEKVYRGVPAAQWCADMLLNQAEDEDKAAMAQIISEKVIAMDDKLYTPLITAKTSKKEHITRDQKIKTTLDLMMNV
jgi:hypothetical protein